MTRTQAENGFQTGLSKHGLGRGRGQSPKKDSQHQETEAQVLRTAELQQQKEQTSKAVDAHFLNSAVLILPY